MYVKPNPKLAPHLRAVAWVSQVMVVVVVVVVVVVLWWYSALPGMKSIQKLLSGERTAQRAHKERKVFGQKAERMASHLGFHFSGFVPSERMRVLQGAELEEEHKQQVGIRTFDLLLLLLGSCVHSNSYKGLLADYVFRILNRINTTEL